MNPIAIQTFSSVTIIFTGVITERDGKKVYSMWKAGNEVMKINGSELVNLKKKMRSQRLARAEAGVAGEVSTLSKMDIVVKTIGALAGIASFVFVGLEIEAAVDIEVTMTLQRPPNDCHELSQAQTYEFILQSAPSRKHPPASAHVYTSIICAYIYLLLIISSLELTSEWNSREKT